MTPFNSPTAMKAMAVCENLYQKIIAAEGLDTIRHPIVTISVYWVRVDIGEFVVWHSEDNDSSELTSKFCWDAFIKEIKGLSVYLPKKRAPLK